MPNKYTQLYSTPYVPQYSPPNMQLMQQAGQNLWKRQEQGLQQYDALQESLNQLDVLEQDKPKLKQKAEQINSQLAQFTDANDFIDAQPAIRKQARQLQADIASGDLGIAVQNKKNALKTFEAIEKAENWSPQEKEAMKNLYLQGYEGADKSGRLGVMGVPEKVDIEAKAREVVSDIDPQTVEKLALVDTPGGGKITAEVQTKKRERQRIDNAVANLFGDQEVINSLTMEARLQGKTSPEEISEYVRKRANSLAVQMRNDYGTESTALSNYGVGEDEGSGSGTRLSATTSIETFEEGKMQLEAAIPDLETVVDDLRDARNAGDTKAAAGLMQSLDIAFSSALQQGTISEDDVEFMRKNMDTALNQYSEIGKGVDFVLANALKGTSIGAQASARRTSPEAKRANEIWNKLEKHIDETAGFVGKAVVFTEDKRRKDMNFLLGNLNPAQMDYLDYDKRSKDESVKQQEIKNLLNNGELEAIEYNSDNLKPVLRVKHKDNEDNWTTTRLIVPSTGTVGQQGHQDVFAKIIDTAFDDPAVKREIIGKQIFSDAPAAGQNIVEKLPNFMKAQLGGKSYLSMSPVPGTSGMVTAEIGSEEDHKPITKLTIFNQISANIAEHARDNNPEGVREGIGRLISMVENSNLSETRKASIKSGVINYFTKKQVDSESMKILKENLEDSPYMFKNQLEAFNIATTIQKP